MMIREMIESDIARIVQLYITYYNDQEQACWTEQTAYKRIYQVWSIVGGYSLILEQDGELIGFVLGYLKQYDDLIAYELDEIVIANDYQGKGLGTILMDEVEEAVRDKGAMLIELKAVNDAMHEHFYTKAGYKSVNSFVIKTKWL